MSDREALIVGLLTAALLFIFGALAWWPLVVYSWEWWSHAVS
jgi:hypothetical protein